MNRCIRAVLPLITVMGLGAGCSQTASEQSLSSSPSVTASSTSKKPSVVVTTDVLCDITKQIAQDTVDLKCLVAAGTDSHVYQATPDDRQAIEKADLVLYAGHGFEPTLIKSIKATTGTSPKIAVNELAVPNPLKAAEEDHDHEAAGKKADKTDKAASPEAEHDHGEEDPHVWHDAKNGIAIAQTIQTQLAKILPSQSTTYEQNTKALTATLTKIDDWIKTQIATIPAASRRLITTHDALGYYSKAYGLPIEGALMGLSTEEKPTAARVKTLVDVLKKTGVPTIFAEASNSSKLLETIAQDAKVKISTAPLYADGLGASGSRGDTYPKMLMANTQVIVEGLGGKFQALSLP